MGGGGDEGVGKMVGGGEIKRNGRGVEMEEGEWEVR